MNNLTINPSLNILNTTLSSDGDNSILAQLGDVVNKITEHDDVVWMQHIGFASRPPKAVPGSLAAECIVLQSDGLNYVIASKDHSTQNQYGQLQEGETCLYAVGPDRTSQGKILINKNGDIIVSTTDSNTSSGQTVSYGFKHDGLNISGHWGSLTYNNDNGCTITTKGGIKFNLDDLVVINDGADQLVLNSKLVNYINTQIVLAYNTHTHVGAAPGSPTSPPVVPLQGPVDLKCVSLKIDK